METIFGFVDLYWASFIFQIICWALIIFIKSNRDPGSFRLWVLLSLASFSMYFRDSVGYKATSLTGPEHQAIPLGVFFGLIALALMVRDIMKYISPSKADGSSEAK